jgi:hypothetical protein
MSNRVKKISENAKARQNYKKYVLYGSTAGSCIVTIGKLAGKTENELVAEFDKLKNNDDFSKCNNIQEVCDWLIDYFKVDEQYKNNIVLVYDEDERYTPMVTLEVDGTILPLDPAGTSLGILSMIGVKDNIIYEYVYEEE